MKKFVERRYISPEELRRTCIKENWYTKGSNEEYYKLFQMCFSADHLYAELTTDLIAAMAADIQKHSDIEQDEENLLNIMFIICAASMTAFDIVEE